MQARLTLNPHTRGTISLKEVVVTSFTSMGTTTTMVMATSIMATTTMVDSRVSMEDLQEIITMVITMEMVTLATIQKSRRIYLR